MDEYCLATDKEYLNGLVELTRDLSRIKQALMNNWKSFPNFSEQEKRDSPSELQTLLSIQTL